MKVVFLSSAAPDVRWFTLYYRAVFPAGSRQARLRLERTLSALAGNR